MLHSAHDQPNSHNQQIFVNRCSALRCPGQERCRPTERSPCCSKISEFWMEHCSQPENRWENCRQCCPGPLLRSTCACRAPYVDRRSGAEQQFLRADLDRVERPAPRHVRIYRIVGFGSRGSQIIDAICRQLVASPTVTTSLLDLGENPFHLASAERTQGVALHIA